jgi:hypothetical protein
MIHLSIENIKSGMILAQPVHNRQGVLLLEAGAKITQKSIRIFKSWGINEITVKGDRSDSKDPVGDSEIQGKEPIEKQLKEKFSDVLDDPVMNAIFKAACFCLTKSIPDNESENEHP